jgi:DNA-binding transcriptional LysR family regulator
MDQGIYYCCILDVTRLRVLVAVAQHGSVTAAARALNYAQPSVSHHLARLEAETGGHAHPALGTGHPADRRRPRSSPGGRRRSWAGWTPPSGSWPPTSSSGRNASGWPVFASALATIVPAALSRLAAGHPGIDLLLTEAEPPEAMRMLRAGQVDVALVSRHTQNGTPVGPARRRGRGPARLILDEQVHLVTRPQAPRRPGAAQPGGSPAAAPSPGGPARRPSPARPVRPARPAADLAAPGAQPLDSRVRALPGPSDLALPARRVQPEDRLHHRRPRRRAGTGRAPGWASPSCPGWRSSAARHPGIHAQPLPGAWRQVLAVTYGQPPDPRAVDHLLDILTLAAAATATGPGSRSPAGAPGRERASA